MEATEAHGIKRKRSENIDHESEAGQLKLPRTECDTAQPRFDTSTMPVVTESAEERYQMLEKLGEGTFGHWYKVCDKQTRQVFAAKKLNQWKHEWDVHDLRHVNIGLALSHPHLRQVLDVVSIKPDSLTKDLKVVLIAEYCTYNLGQWIWQGRGQSLSREYIKSVVHQLLLAVEYLHRNQLMHRDIKPHKIFVKDDAIKLDPSGALREWSTDGTLTPVVVTLWYRAPELLLGLKQYDYAVDLWSVGCIMAGNGVPDMLARIVHILGPVRPCAWPELAELSPAASTLLRAPEPPVPLTQIIPRLSRTAHDLLRGLLCYNPRARLTARQALQHEWFYEPSH